MPKFYFHTADGISAEQELPTVAAAKCEAARYAGAVICDEAEKFWLSNEFFLAVSDEHGRMVFTLEAFGHDAPVDKVRDLSFEG